MATIKALFQTILFVGAVALVIALVYFLTIFGGIAIIVTIVFLIIRQVNIELKELKEQKNKDP